MKIFIDSGDTKDIKEAHDMGLIDGVTTNPTLASKSGKPFKQLIMEITEIVDGPISAEVVSVTAPEMIKEGEGSPRGTRTSWSRCRSSPRASRRSRRSPPKASRPTSRSASPARRRCSPPRPGRPTSAPSSDASTTSAPKACRSSATSALIYDNYGYETQILTASARSPMHFLEAARIGSDVITAPFSVLKQLLKHPLTDSGLKQFLADWEKAKQ
jgi:transaldolase